MSCNTCQSKFSFFTRENGCPNCGFSYCSKCLKYKCDLPAIGVKKVCGKCHNKLQLKKMNPDQASEGSSSMNGASQSLSPIDITQKLESLENPAKPPIVMYRQEGTHWDKLKSGLEPVDQEIVNRLMKLKGEDKQVPPPSISEIKRRLALLKDQNPENKTINIHQVDTRTDQEKTDDLIKEYLERLQLSKSDSIGDLQERLDSLKGIDSSKFLSSKRNVDDDDDDEDAVTKKLIKKALAEAALEAKYDDVDELEELEENKEASCDEDESACCDECGDTDDMVYCRGCKGKLFCSICFEDNHDEDEVDMRKHTKVPFKPSKTSTPD